MAYKIPDSPNIIGGQTVLRQPDSLQPSGLTPELQVDTAPTNNALKSMSEAVSIFEEEKNAVFMGEVQSQYIQHMNNYKRQIFDKYKGKQAHDLYANFLKKESDKYFADITGGEKQDGKVRIANNDLKKRFKDWVDKQQSTYISQSAAYEAEQFSAWRESVWQAQDADAASLIASAYTDIELQNGIDAIYANTRDMLRGMDENYISQVSAKKIDDAVASFITNRIATSPIDAHVQLIKNPIVSDALTSATKETLKQSIREAYIKKAQNEYAQGIFSGSNKGVEYLNANVISGIWDTTDADEISSIQDMISAEANKRADTRRKEVQGVRSSTIGSLANEYLNANTDEEKFNVLTKLQAVDSRIAYSLEEGELNEAYSDSIVAAMVDAGIDPNYERAVRELAEMKQYEHEKKIDLSDPKQISREAQNRFFGTSVEDIITDIAEKQQRKEKKDFLEEARKKIYSSMTEEQIKVADEYQKIMDTRESALPIFNQVHDDIVSGKVSGYDERMSGLPLDMQRELLATISTKTLYNDLSRQLPELSSVMKEVDPQYSKLSVFDKRVAEEQILKACNEYKKKNGELPTGVALRNIVSASYANSVSPESAALQGAIDEASMEVLAMEDIDYLQDPASARKILDRQGLTPIEDIAFRAFSEERTTPKVSNNTYEKSMELAEKALDRFADSLPSNQANVVELNKDMLTRWITAGNINDVVVFVKGFRNKNQ